MTEADQLDQARALFKSFHGRNPDTAKRELINIAGVAVPTVGLAVGQFVGIGYKAAGDGIDYFHEFAKERRPLVYVSSDGQQVYILEGGYRFTERGFIG